MTYSVGQVAQLAGVSAAAVRARLSEGALKGQQSPRGGRLVWEVDPASAAAYIEAHAGSAGRPAQPPTRSRVHEARIAQPLPPVASARGEVAQPGAHVEPAPVSDEKGLDLGAGEQPLPAWVGTRPPTTLEELARENSQLRASLAALARAHRALVELVEGEASGR